jgi:adenylate cyclase
VNHADLGDDLSEPVPGVPLERPRLAAVVFTDVVAYSARMQRDETATIAAVQADFARMREACTQHGGEVLNTMGDGMMLCFGGAVDAVTFALEIQAEFGRRNDELPKGQGLKHRVGIHIGDVYRVEGGHVAGDGVNIAARLEPRAPHGGICISQIVYDTVKAKVPMKAQFLGPQSFKNIAEPLPVWSVAPDSGVKAAPAVVQVQKQAFTVRRLVVAAVSAGLAFVAVEALWTHKDTLLPGGRGAAAAGVVGDKAIAVLPFSYAGKDKDGAYLADGIHGEILAQLSLLGELRVVSRASVMHLRAAGKDVREIGKELGVGSLVEGSVRREGNQLRVTAELVDVRSDTHLWAGKYDREPKDIFVVQSEIASSIAAALKAALSPRDQQRLAQLPTSSLEAWDLFLRHEELAHRVSAASSRVQRIALLSKAVALDPKFALAWARLAQDQALAEPATREQAMRFMTQAVALAPDDPRVKAAEGAFRLNVHDHARALQAWQQVLKGAPSNVEALHGFAEVHSELFNTTEATASLEAALKVDGRHAGALDLLSRNYARLRHFPRAQLLRLQLIEAYPDDLDLRAGYYRSEYAATGSWAGYDNWRATVGKDAGADVPRLRAVDIERAAARRDFAAVQRLLDLETRHANGAGSAAGRAELDAQRALAWLAAGDRTKAAAAARAALPVLEAQLQKSPDEGLLYTRAAMLALLGQRAPALAALAEGGQLARKNGNKYAAELMRNRVIEIHALLGERAAALGELTKRRDRPGVLVYDLAARMELFSLWDDPAFKAVVNERASHTPLPLSLKL